MEYLARKCPTCFDSAAQKPEVIANLAAEDLSLGQLEAQWSGFFKNTIKQKTFFSYYRCPECCLLFCPLFFSQDHLSQLYRNMADNTAGLEQKILIKTQNSYFNFLKKYSPNLGEHYFEMGPDIGLFTNIASRKAHIKHYWLAEPNKAVWKTLKNNLAHHPEHSVKIFEDILIDNPIPDNTLDTTVMIHVLDHMLNPLEILKHIHRKMIKGSTLMIVTHDESSLLARILKQRWPAYCLQHPQLYNSKSMYNLLASVGFNSIKINKTYNYFPPGYLLNHLLWVFGIRNIKMPLFSSLSMPIKLGNIITLATK
jgi:hypothetical protein